MSAAVPVSELAEQVRGVTYGKGDASSTPRPGYLPVLRAGNITENGLTFDDLVFVPAERISEKQRIRQNDVVIAASSGSLDVVGKAARALDDYEGGFGAFCKVLRPGPNVDPAYFAHFFRTPKYRQRVSALAGGVNINNLRNEHLNEMQIPLPPLPEQRRIAEILDKVDALRAKRRASLAQLDTLTQSIFLDMFGDPATNPKGWPIEPLKNCTERIQIGPFGSLLHQEDYVDGGIPFVNPKHIQNGAIEVGSGESVTARKYAQLGAYHLRSGDVVMGRRGEMGRCAIVEESSGALLCGTGSLFIRPDNLRTGSLFLFATLSNASLKSRLERLSLGQTLPNLNSRIVEQLDIPLAPLALQRDFAQRVAGAKALAATQDTSLSVLNNLFAAIQHRAFRGEL